MVTKYFKKIGVILTFSHALFIHFLHKIALFTIYW